MELAVPGLRQIRGYALPALLLRQRKEAPDPDEGVCHVWLSDPRNRGHYYQCHFRPDDPLQDRPTASAQVPRLLLGRIRVARGPHGGIDGKHRLCHVPEGRRLDPGRGATGGFGPVQGPAQEEAARQGVRHEPGLRGDLRGPAAVRDDHPAAGGQDAGDGWSLPTGSGLRQDEHGRGAVQEWIQV
uniref:(northern house mosquito) hypothetical protein n=1 Tax=Culex pipiens TaxID=7175 RepID=A0A8D8DT81_CULPI